MRVWKTKYIPDGLRQLFIIFLFFWKGLYQWVYRTHEDAEEDRAQQSTFNADLNGSHLESSKGHLSMEGNGELDPLHKSQQEAGKGKPTQFHEGRKCRQVRHFLITQEERGGGNVKCNYCCRKSLLLAKCVTSCSFSGKILSCSSLFGRNMKFGCNIGILQLWLNREECPLLWTEEIALVNCGVSDACFLLTP